MNLGQKSSVIKSALGVKNSMPSLSLGVKSQAPHITTSSVHHNDTSAGIINESNGNNTHREPMMGVKLPHHKVNHNRNYLEKATKIKHEKGVNKFV